jgi:hypothetical protein
MLFVLVGAGGIVVYPSIVKPKDFLSQEPFLRKKPG